MSFSLLTCYKKIGKIKTLKSVNYATKWHFLKIISRFKSVDWNLKCTVSQFEKCRFEKNVFKVFVTRALYRTLFPLNVCNFVNFKNSRKSFCMNIFEDTCFEKIWKKINSFEIPNRNTPSNVYAVTVTIRASKTKFYDSVLKKLCSSS